MDASYVTGWLAGPGFRSALARNAYLWAGLAAFLLGFALAQSIRWAIARRKGRARAASRRSAWAVAGLALALLAATALLVLPPKAGLSDGLLPFWGGIFAALGLLAGCRPAIGFPLVILLCALSGAFLVDALVSWLPLAEPLTLARVFPFSESQGRWRAEFIVFQRDSIPAAQGLEIPGGEAGLVVERLELSGPATLVGIGTWYRLAGLADSSGRSLVDFPARLSLLDRIEPLEPGSRAGPRGALVRRWREASPAIRLSPLQAAYYAFKKGEAAELVLAASVLE